MVFPRFVFRSETACTLRATLGVGSVFRLAHLSSGIKANKVHSSSWALLFPCQATTDLGSSTSGPHKKGGRPWTHTLRAPTPEPSVGARTRSHWSLPSPSTREPFNARAPTQELVANVKWVTCSFFRRFPGPGVLFGVRVSRALDQVLRATTQEPMFSFFFPRW